jgi:hypothetical protein
MDHAANGKSSARIDTGVVLARVMAERRLIGARGGKENHQCCDSSLHGIRSFERLRF